MLLNLVHATNQVLLYSSFLDPGPHGNSRYSPHMLPEIEKKDFRKGAQVRVHILFVKFSISSSYAAIQQLRNEKQWFMYNFLVLSNFKYSKH